MSANEALPFTRTVDVRRIQTLAVLVVVTALAACTTTTRSVNESPRDPQAQRSTTTPATGQRSSRSQRSSASAQRLSSAQMDRLTQDEVDSLLVRDRTSAQQVAQIFGQPHSMTRSGDEIYWNYTHQFRDERRNVGGLKSLTILFDDNGRVLDYDFQDNSYNLQ